MAHDRDRRLCNWLEMLYQRDSNQVHILFLTEGREQRLPLSDLLLITQYFVIEMTMFIVVSFRQHNLPKSSDITSGRVGNNRLAADQQCIEEVRMIHSEELPD